MKTLKFLTHSFLILLMSFSMINCKEDDQVTPDPIVDLPNPDGEALSGAFSDNILEAIQTFVIDAEEGGTIIGEKGTHVVIYPGSLQTSNGDPVTGDVEIDLIEIYGKADMLLTNIPTNGKRPNGDNATLVSGGEFYVNAKQGGENLETTMGFEIQAPTEEVNGEMNVFNRVENCDGDNCQQVWAEKAPGQEDAIRGIDGFGPDGQGLAYGAFQQNFGWTNIDRWYNDPRPKTTIHADVPDGYDNTNCVVYISYDGEPTALARFDSYLPTQELFTEHYGLIPIGLEVHFIMVSMEDDEWQYKIQAATIGEDHVEIIGDLIPTTESELITLINNLP